MDSPTDLTTSEGSTATAPILLRGTLKHGEVEALFQSPAAMQQSLELSDFESLCGLLSAVLGERELQGPHLELERTRLQASFAYTHLFSLSPTLPSFHP